MLVGIAATAAWHAPTAFKALQVRTAGDAGKFFAMEIVGVENMLRGMIRFGALLARNADRIDGNAAQEMVDRMRADVATDSGRLFNGITWRFEDGAYLVEASAIRVADGGKDSEDYALFVEKGTRPGRRGDRADTVSDVGFFAADDFAETSGHRGTPTARSRRVYRDHPGTPAQPFFFDNARDVLRGRYAELAGAPGEAWDSE